MHKVLLGKEVVFFDAGYTIVYPASGDWMFTNRFNEFAADRLKGRSAEQIAETRTAGLDFLAKNHLIPTEAEEAEQFFHYYRVISDRLDLKLTDAQAMDAARDRTYNMDNYIIYPDARRVIQTLGRIFPLGIISDTWPSIENMLRTLDLRQYFSFVTYSYELGVWKPNRRMYEDALCKCGHAAEKTVFIDDVPQNLAGAAELGITPILIAANPASDVETPYAKIRSLSELL